MEVATGPTRVTWFK